MSWLSRHSAALTTLASIIQSLAVLIGIWFAVWEFVLSGNQQNMRRVQNTLQFVERRYDNSLIDAADTLHVILLERFKSERKVGVTDMLTFVRNASQAANLDRFYGMLTTCVLTGTCDNSSAKSFFCEDAVRLSDVVKSINDGAYPFEQIRMSDLEVFAVEICPYEQLSSEASEDATDFPWEKWSDIIEGMEAEK